jgi:hypothetical protein
MNDDKTHLVVTKSMAQVNIHINLVISRSVNANASPDMPKPLAAQTAHAPFGEQVAHAPFGDTIHLGYVRLRERCISEFWLLSKKVLELYF